jgi:hypothetical protein
MHWFPGYGAALCAASQCTFGPKSDVEVPTLTAADADHRKHYHTLPQFTPFAGPEGRELAPSITHLWMPPCDGVSQAYNRATRAVTGARGVRMARRHPTLSPMSIHRRAQCPASSLPTTNFLPRPALPMVTHSATLQAPWRRRSTVDRRHHIP